MEEEKKGIGLFGLIGLVVSSCIGSGVFALTGQIGQVAAPGSALVAWGVVGVGSSRWRSVREPGREAVRPARHLLVRRGGLRQVLGLHQRVGLLAVGAARQRGVVTILMSTLGFFLPYFLPGNNIRSIVVASVIMWGITFLIRGVESAAFLNAIVMIAKVVPIVVFILFSIVLFNAGVFTADFWGQMASNAAAMAGEGVDLGGVGDQIVNCLIIMMWSFIGIEGAMVVSARARKKSEAGKATVIGLVVLLLVYVGASVLPFGYLPYAEIGALDKPAMLYVFESMAPGWGGAFISVALIVAVLGSWLSFTILPSETTSLMAKHELLPPVFNRLNKKGSPQISLIVVGACTQAFMITLLFTEDAYNFAFSMCTVAIVITWAFAAAYQVKFSAQHHEWGQCAIGIVAVAFQVVGVLFNGWSFLLLTCVGYIPGFFFYWRARKEAGATALTTGEKAGMGAISALGVLSLVLLAMGVISF